MASAGTSLPVHATIDDGTCLVWSDAATGAFQIETASRGILVQAVGYQAARVDLAEYKSYPIEVRLVPAGVQEIVVQDSQARPIAGAKVFALVKRPDLRAWTEQLLGHTEEGGTLRVGHAGSLYLVARHGERTSVPRLCDGGGCLVCDQTTTSRVYVRSEGGVPVACNLLLTFLDGEIGLRVSYKTDDSGLAIVPAGRASAMVPGYTLTGLIAAPAFAGQLLDLAGGQDAVVTVSTLQLVVTAVDANTGKGLPAAIALEALLPTGWERHAGPVQAADGATDISPLVDAAEVVSADYVRLRFSHPGYEDSFVGLSAAIGAKRVPMRRIEERCRLEFKRDGAAYTGPITIRLAGDDSGAVVFDGVVGSDGMDVAVPIGVGLDIMSSNRRGALRLAQVGPIDSLAGPAIEVTLPRSAMLVYEGRSSSPVDIVARRSDGVVVGGVHSDSAIYFEDMFPGAYRVGPRREVLLDARSLAIVEEVLPEAAQTVRPWSSWWGHSRPIEGQVRMANGAALPRGVLRVLAWSGMVPRGNPAVLLYAVPVSGDGVFKTGPLDYLPDRVGVYSVLPHGAVLPLAEVALDCSNQIVLQGREVVLRMVDSAPVEGQLLLVAPQDASGRSTGQWSIPCRTSDVLRLGVVPETIREVHLIAGTKSRAIQIGDSGETVVNF